MKYLNLTPGFNPSNARHGDLINFQKFTFHGGEPHIKLEVFANDEDIVVTSRLRNSNDFMMLMVASEALSQSSMVFHHKHLVIPYFPGARQDRRMVEGEPLTVKVYADMINSLGYDSVEVFDPHSDVCMALLDNSEATNNHRLVQRCLQLLDVPDLVLVSPDAGSNKKILKLAQHVGADRIVKCDKVRDIKTGNLSGFSVYGDHLANKPCVIVDDICDGGGTFIGLAQVLKEKGAGDLYLIVSHGIFSNGFVELSKYFKRIFTTDSWVNNYALEIPEIEKRSEIVTVVPLCQIK
jgi:ribose-phosphate pyrophosphokinase